MSMPWTDLIREIGSAVRQVLPNPQAQAEFDMKMLELAAQAEARDNDLMLAQVEVNKTEATHANLFVAGWRPFIGWTGGVALGYTWMLAPLLRWLSGMFGYDADMPALEPEAIWPIVTAMLGLGTMRSYEKTKGVATSVNGTVPQPLV